MLGRYTKFLTLATFLLIIAGGLVTSQDYGLAVPDWPKSYGQWMPPMQGGVLYEHGHRMVAATVGFLTIILMVLLHWKERRRWVRVLGMIALSAVVAQGVLGGVTVLLGLAKRVSVIHATLAQSFFSLIVSLALFTSKDWIRGDWKISQVKTPWLPRLLLLTTCIIYLQLILGAWMRHSEAAMAIPTFPLSNGRWIPEFTSSRVAIHFAHRLGALTILLLVSTNTLVIMRSHRGESRLVRPVLLWLALVLLQITLGAFAIWTTLAVPVTTAHVAVGALTLATGVVLTLRSFRLFRAEQPETTMERTVLSPAVKTI